MSHIRVNMNRKYLVRALGMGLRELCLTGEETAILALDDRKQYVWMPLTPEPAVPPATNAIRIESPAAGTEVPVIPTTKHKQERAKPVSENTNANGKAGANGQVENNGQNTGQGRTTSQAKANGQARAAHKPGHQDIDGLIRQAEALRASLRDTLLKTDELVKSLKQHRRRNRALQTTLASLRQLKTLGV